MGTEEDRSRRRGNPTGPTAANVAANLKELRGSQSLRALSARLAEIGHPLAASALQRIESGERRVDVDDLTALACALDVSPLALLKIPASANTGRLTGTAEHTSSELALWLQGLEPLSEQRDRLADALKPSEWQALLLWAKDLVGGSFSLERASTELKARMVFYSRQALHLGIGPVWIRMTAHDAPVYVIDDAGDVLFQMPETAPGIEVHVVGRFDESGRPFRDPAEHAEDLLVRIQREMDELRRLHAAREAHDGDD